MRVEENSKKEVCGSGVQGYVNILVSSVHDSDCVVQNSEVLGLRLL